MKFVSKVVRDESERSMMKQNISIPDNVPVEDWREERQIQRQPGDLEPVAQESFMDCLPREVVLTNLWPKIMAGYSEETCLESLWPEMMLGVFRVENFQICCSLRPVCSGWMRFIEGTREWRVGLQFWIKGSNCCKSSRSVGCSFGILTCSIQHGFIWVSRITAVFTGKSKQQHAGAVHLLAATKLRAVVAILPL
ncbi:hypothetical protein M758_UG205600 [Ceratodon purpureus]|nr:hypothetical protein M758_UG205600 [Ceratodon purpureus]